MPKIEQIGFYLGLNIINFYLVPWFIKDTTSAIMLLLVLMPLCTMLTAMAYGKKQGFHLIYPVLVALLFLPSLLLFYNSTAWVYAPLHGAIAMAGSAGSAMWTERGKKK